MLIPRSFDAVQVHRWYEVRDDYKGQDLCSDAKMVDSLAAIRATVVDRAGDMIDLLADGAASGPNTSLECQNSIGVIFSDATSALRPCQIQQLSTGSPAHILEQLRFGDEVKAVDYKEVNEISVHRSINFPEVTGRRIVLTIERSAPALAISRHLAHLGHPPPPCTVGHSPPRLKVLLGKRHN